MIESTKPLGAGPVGGTTVPVNRCRTGQLLDSTAWSTTPDATGCRDFMVEALATLANLMVTLSRVAEDIILWSSSEFGFVELADEFLLVSSIMHRKRTQLSLSSYEPKPVGSAGPYSILGVLKGLPSGYSSDFRRRSLLWDGSTRPSRPYRFSQRFCPR